MYTSLHFYHHIYNTITFNVHWFSIDTISYITKSPLTYTILRLYHHIYNTMQLNKPHSSFIPSHL